MAEQTCVRCGGRGGWYEGKSYWVRCQVCNGTGKVPAEEKPAEHCVEVEYREGSGPWVWEGKVYGILDAVLYEACVIPYQNLHQARSFRVRVERLPEVRRVRPWHWRCKTLPPDSYVCPDCKCQIWQADGMTPPPQCARCRVLFGPPIDLPEAEVCDG